MTSHAAQACCYQGAKHEGAPVGTIEKVGDYEAYIKYPADKSTEKGILFITDVLGHKYPNAQLIADDFAANGYFVIMPDLFFGDPVSEARLEGFDIFKWFEGAYNAEKKPHTPPHIDPIIDTCLIAMKEQYGCKKIGAVGYCFGAKYVVRHLRPDQGKIDVGYFAHPSFVDADELRDIKGPLAIAAAETDSVFPPEKRHESEEILKEVGFPYQINLYSGVVHGFAARADLSKPLEKYAKESAFFLALQWFETFLK